MKKIILLMFLSVPAFSQTYQLGQASFAGTGCPAGSASATTTDDGSVVSILFSEFMVKVAGRTNCTVSIPVSVTPGYVVQSAYVQLNGFASLPNNRIGTNIEIMGLANGGRVAARFSAKTNLQGPMMQNFSATHRVIQSLPGRPKCNPNQQIYLSINANIASRIASKDTLFILDSADSGAGVNMGIELVPCVN
jgi:Domain of unknown function (DUF4360)